MRRHITGVLAATTVGAVVSALGVTGAGVSAAATSARQAAASLGSSHARPAPGAQLWVKRYNGPGNSFDHAASMAISPGGRTVFVTGTSEGAKTGPDYATVAYNAATGTRLWVSRYTGPPNRPNTPIVNFDEARSVAVSPNGRTVFVTGTSAGPEVSPGPKPGPNADYATIAYNAATGARLWISRFDMGSDLASSVAVSPNGRMVFVTGTSATPTSGARYATVAYNAATGAQLWVSLYGTVNRYNSPASLAVSPNGGRVFVTGRSEGFTFRGDVDYATVAYNAATGAQLWAKRYNGPGNRYDAATSLAVGRNGGTVYVTGVSDRTTDIFGSFDYATIAYNAATGARLWVSRYNGPGNNADVANSVAVSPSGRTVFVTGGSTGRTSGADYATVAYRAATGAQLWVSRYNGPGNRDDGAMALAVGSGGRTVFVTGESTGRTSGTDYATIAYNATTGARLWVSRYNGPGNGPDSASAIVASPCGRGVFVTGDSQGRTSGTDYATIAYHG